MANPFKDAEKRKKVAPGGHQEPKEVEVTPVEPVVEPVVEKPVEKENPLEGMIEQKQTGKPCGFYLSVEAIEKLDKLAKQNKCSKSKALDVLLRNL